MKKPAPKVAYFGGGFTRVQYAVIEDVVMHLSGSHRRKRQWYGTEYEEYVATIRRVRDFLNQMLKDNPT